jgi:hypothetical protein
MAAAAAAAVAATSSSGGGGGGDDGGGGGGDGRVLSQAATTPAAATDAATTAATMAAPRQCYSMAWRGRHSARPSSNIANCKFKLSKTPTVIWGDALRARHHRYRFGCGLDHKVGVRILARNATTQECMAPLR